MLETGVETEREDEFVGFVEAESEATGEFHCADCGYGVSVHTRLPACPMCAGRMWEPATWPRPGARLL